MNKYTHGNGVCKRFDVLYGKRTFAQFQRYDNLIRQFKKRFGFDNCFVASASGRVEIIGNHTDHNGGSVIASAVNADIVAAFLPNNSNSVRINSVGYPQITFDLDKMPQLAGGIGLAEGVFLFLKNAGYSVGGVDVFSHSQLLSGAGISSSAAYETLIATIVNVCFNDGKIPVDAMAKAGQFAENRYLNKPCGLLDQGASLAGGTVKFDFSKGFDCTAVNARTDNVRFALLNTGKSHAALSHLYASIPAEMFAVAKFLGKEKLIEVDSELLYCNERAICAELGLRPYLRAKHFFEENVRVGQMAEAMERGDVERIIDLINASGDSSMHQLQNCAVDENDTAIADAVEFARSLGNVGARVHGGGFAGTVLCVTSKTDFDDVCRELSQRYGEQNVLPLNVRQIGATVL